MNDIDVIVTSNTTWTCANCKCYITAEPTEVWDGTKTVIFYYPVSRYWAPGSKPNTASAVYCRVECAQPHGENSTRLGPRGLPTHPPVYGPAGPKES